MSINVNNLPPLIDQAMVDKAQKLMPDLHREIRKPEHIVEVVADEDAFQGWRIVPTHSYDELARLDFGKQEEVILDFGDHMVGYVTVKITATGSPPDAPLRLKLTFGEMPSEVAEPFDKYEGWLSSSWLQEEIVTLDVLPCELSLPRRYAFRYLKLSVIDTSPKYKVAFREVTCTTVTSADVRQIEPLPDHVPEDLRQMDRISIKTLQDCMQTVFEDGPKRDRRLWIGDLRLQAQVNYETFRNNDLVRRCLYLFAGMTLDGRVGACVFETPEPHVDDTLLFDYSLIFIPTLYDYYIATQDRKTLQELWPTAKRQIEYALERVDESGLVQDDPSWWCFIDWQQQLNKQGPAQAVLIYAMRQAIELARIVGQPKEADEIQKQLERVLHAARTLLWDDASGFYVSGAERQISWATQVWMVLAEVPNPEDRGPLMDRLLEVRPEVDPVSPYMYHHLIEALILSDRHDKALELMRLYWGGMMEDGADTFWELYNPYDKKWSPYGSNLINSYCHAWSCTPSYLIRKYWANKS